MEALLDMNTDELKMLMAELGQPSFRAAQLFKGFHGVERDTVSVVKGRAVFIDNNRLSVLKTHMLRKFTTHPVARRFARRLAEHTGLLQKKLFLLLHQDGFDTLFQQKAELFWVICSVK